MSLVSLKGKVAIVTGASRGIGKGIALELGSAGATVYLTGRIPAKSEAAQAKSSSLEQAAEEVTRRGGRGIAAHCDHSDPEEVRKLFERVEKEQNGQLDILVNNVLSCTYWFLENEEKKFWEFKERPEEAYDIVNNVGLRNHFVCSSYAAKLMTKRKTGLIINISSTMIVNTIYGPLYGLSTLGLARMASDMAHDLKGTGVRSIAVMPGWTLTEIFGASLQENPNDPYSKYFVEHGQSMYYAGRAIVFLAQRPDLLEKYNGHSISTTELGDEHNVLDVDGKKHPDPLIHKYKTFIDDFNRVNKENAV